MQLEGCVLYQYVRVDSEPAAWLLVLAGTSLFALDESKCMGCQRGQMPHVLQLLPLG